MAFIWNGANANYNDTANWTGPGPGTAPPDATGESAVFNGGGNTTVTVSGTVSPDSWVIVGATAYTFNGGTVSFGTIPGLENASTANQTINLQISGVGRVTQGSTGSLTLSAANTYTGTTFITNGTLFLFGAGTLGNTNNATSISGGGTLDLGGTTQTQDQVWVSNGTIKNGILKVTGSSPPFRLIDGTIESSATIDAESAELSSGAVNGVLVGGTIVKGSSGTVTFSAANTYRGTTYVDDGTLILSGAGTLGNTHNLTRVTSGVLDLGTTTQTQSRLQHWGGTVQNGTLIVDLYQLKAGTLAGNATISANAFDLQAGTVDGVLTGAGGISKTTAGTVTLSNGNTFTGNVDIYDGVLVAAHNNGLVGDALGSGDIVFHGGTLRSSLVVSRLHNDVVFSGDGTIETLSNRSISLWSSISGSGDWTINGSVTVVGNNTHTGATNLVAGHLVVPFGNGIGDLSAVTIAAGTFLDLGPSSETIGSLAGAGIVRNGGNGPSDYVLTTGGNGSSTVYSGSIIDEHLALNKVGGGTFTLAGANTYEGATTITGGTLSVSADNNLGSGGALNFNGGILQVTGTAFHATSRAINWGANGGGFDIVQTTNIFTVDDNLTGSGGLRKLGFGQLQLAGTNTYSGATSIDPGLLVALGGQAIGDQSAVTIAASGFLEIDSSETIGSLAGAGDVTGYIAAPGIYALTTGGNGTSTVFSGTISDGVNGLLLALTKAGDGTFTLSGTNTYTGPTTIDGGVLQVDGTIASSEATVNGGAMLAGHGTTGAVNVLAGGTLAPGASAGTLNTLDLAFVSGATFKVELGGIGAGQSDQVNVTGTVHLAGAELDIAFINGFNPETATVTGAPIVIINNDGSDAVGGVFNGLAEGATVFRGDSRFSLSYVGGDGNDVILTALDDAPTDIALSTASVVENSPDGTVVGALTATDPDDTSGFTYTLTDDAGGRFAIIGSNLVVADGVLLDFEQSTINPVTVRVKDAGGLTFDKSFIVHVTDVRGSSTDDSFTAPAGSAQIEGGGGIDTMSFGFRLVDATVTHSGNEVIIDGPSSHTVLSGFERFAFTDGTVDNADSNPLIDDLFYYARYHDVWNAHLDADSHYNDVGWHEGRDPSAFFDTSIYLSAYPDVAQSSVNPLTHYATVGWAQGRVPSLEFSTRIYLDANPDVQAAGIDPLFHFLVVGAGEGRQPVRPTELIAANGFDFVYYLEHNPDVAAAGVDPFWHFENIGWKEGRDPNARFDTSGYLSTYADVAAAGINPLDHYNLVGWHEGRDPSVSFDTTSYLAAYADVAAAQVNPLNHFLFAGQHEGRSAFADGVWG